VLALANRKFKDNRIPPRGFTNAAFSADGCAPVGTTYDDGQHWDDTLFPVPAGAVRAVATLYYQTSSREYMEFLRDGNSTTLEGQLAFDLWEMFGKSAPVDMDTAAIAVSQGGPAALTGDGVVNGADLAKLLGAWGTPGPGDLDGNGVVNGADLAQMLGDWTT
ncbi:MAG: hypothetical protein ACKORL_07060, partial [Phycisphaerales bacterium]